MRSVFFTGSLTIIVDAEFFQQTCISRWCEPWVVRSGQIPPEVSHRVVKPWGNPWQVHNTGNQILTQIMCVVGFGKPERSFFLFLILFPDWKVPAWLLSATPFWDNMTTSRHGLWSSMAQSLFILCNPGGWEGLLESQSRVPACFNVLGQDVATAACWPGELWVLPTKTKDIAAGRAAPGGMGLPGVSRDKARPKAFTGTSLALASLL